MKFPKRFRKEPSTTWQQYESGKNYNRRIGLYATVRENERFCRGDQWKGVDSAGLPTPVFNLTGRIASYLCNAVLSYRTGLSFTDDSLLFEPEGPLSRRKSEQMLLLNRYMAGRFDSFRNSQVLRDAVQDAVITGDGVFYSYWDDGVSTGQHFRGDLRTVTVDGTNLFVADVTAGDLQAQEYVILAGRAPVTALLREAKRYGADEQTIRSIQPDDDTAEQGSEYADYENDDPDAGKTTYLIKFTRNEQGFVCFEKSVRGGIIRRETTGLRRYPIAHFCWERTKSSYHGSSPITQIVPNQKYINKAYAMAMKHMADTAFSKVIYDKRLIPEWSNAVGEAIGVVSGGDIRAAAATIGVGEMQSDYLELIEQAVRQTKEMAGATDVALGEVDPTNTSAIIALREAAEQPLDGVRASLCRTLEELADNWLDLLREYCGNLRLVPLDGKPARLDFPSLQSESIRAIVDMGASGRYAKATLLNILNELLKGGHITFAQYLKRLPEGLLQDRTELLEEITNAADDAAEKEVENARKATNRPNGGSGNGNGNGSRSNTVPGKKPGKESAGENAEAALRADPYGKRIG